MFSHNQAPSIKSKNQIAKKIASLVNYLLRLEAQEGRLSLLLSWRARCMRMPGLTTINLTENLVICKNMGSKVQKAKIWILENLIIYKSDIIIYKWRFEDILYGFPYIAAHQERACLYESTCRTAPSTVLWVLVWDRREILLVLARFSILWQLASN